MAGLLVGLFIGTLLLTPAGAHVNKNTKHVIKHVWKDISKRVYTREQADDRFPLKSEVVLAERTVLVSPTGTPADNGAALLDAVAGISSPSATNPWLVKVEPGTYDLGTQTLELPPFVDLEGSGRRSTKIRCACSSQSNTEPGAGAVIHLDVASELKSLSVLNNGTGDHLHGVDISGSGGQARIADVEVVVQGTPGFVSGIWLGLNAQADIRNAKVQVFGSPTNASWGIRATSDGVLNVTDSEVVVTDGSRAHGIFASHSTVTVTDSSVAVQGPSDNYGVWNSESVATYTNVTSKASNGPLNEAFHNELGLVGKPAILRGVQALAVGGGDNYYAVRNIDADARISNSRLEAKGVEAYGLDIETNVEGTRHVAVSSTSISAEGDIIQEAIQVDSDAGHILTQVDNSEVVSHLGRWVRINGSASVILGSSLVRGNQAVNHGSGELKCAGVWDESYTFFPDVCPDVP